jgi:predicted nucleic acid-binding protein
VILADTSVWVDHLRANDETLTSLLAIREILIHPFVIGELALGSLRQRTLVLRELNRLPRATVATHHEAMRFIDEQVLFGLGIGYVDVHLLAAVRLTPNASLWARDKQLISAARRLRVAVFPPH